MPSRTRYLAAWGVHLYTALGLPLAFFAVEALAAGNAPRFLLISMLAAFVDGTDGMMARAVDVKHVLPQFSGRRLDDIIDYIHFVALPMMALPALGMLPADWAWLVIFPLMASGYGFCQEHAKTDESFVGFPSLWNVLVVYFYVLHVGPTIIAASILLLSAMVFVPIHYVYPTKTRVLKRTTMGLGMLWTLAMFALAIAPEAWWAISVGLASLYYPAYYLGLSLFLHVQITRTSAHHPGQANAARVGARAVDELA